MSKLIKVRLSERSIGKAILEIIRYKDEMRGKIAELVERLAETGYETVIQLIAEIPEEEKGRDIRPGTTAPYVSADGHVIGAAVTLSGSKVLFIEFSAGITYGTDTYPTEAGAPYGMGTYPGKGHWDDPNGWWYKNESGIPIHTYGNRAYMPMYHAEEAIILNVRHIAREVFGG